MFEIGDKILYPLYGAGFIEDITEREFSGRLVKYYILRLVFGRMEPSVPVETSEALGLRHIISPDRLADVSARLSLPPEKEEPNWNKRYKLNMDRLRTGDILQVCDIFRTLYARNARKALSTGEMKVLTQSRQILFSELMLVSGMNEDETSDFVRNAMNTN